jgi:hypothetical protein
VTAFGDRIFREIVKLNEISRIGPNPIGWLSLKEKEEAPEMQNQTQKTM